MMRIQKPGKGEEEGPTEDADDTEKCGERDSEAGKPERETVARETRE
jgi:hypothetical protein